MRLAAISLMALLAATARADEPKPGPGPRPADSDAPLPEGWPGATGPGAVEVKTYPPYRSAVARADGGSAGADGPLFFALFNHISRKKVAMTAPVVSTYEPTLIDDPRARGSMSMEFLYGSTTQGEAGPGVGAVKVEDHPGATYVCRGVQGRMNPERLRAELAALRAWLDGHKGDWVEAGEARRLGYHGPMTPEAERLWEVQIPVKPAPKAETKGPAKSGA